MVAAEAITMQIEGFKVNFLGDSITEGVGVDPHDPEDYATYTADGLHFNDNGHAVLAERLKAFIEAL